MVQAHVQPPLRMWNALDARAPPATIRGVWENEALGHLVEFSPTGYTVYHRLGGYCLLDTGLVPSYSLYSHDPGVLRLQHYDYREFGGLLQISSEFRRTNGLPQECGPAPTGVAPSIVFDALWSLFQARYAFFAERGVDWSKLRERYEPGAATVRNDAELFDLLSAMLGELGDGHVNLSLGDRSFNAGRSGLRDLLDASWRNSGDAGSAADYRRAWQREVAASALLLLDPGSLKTQANGALEWGRIGGSTGYVRINRFSGFAEDLPRTAQMAILQEALNRMKMDLAGTDRLIVDVALNGGGNDSAAMMVARAFADRPREAIRYEVRGEMRTAIVMPLGAPERRPIVLLTSEVTASAAESFVVMMRAFPHVTHVGTRTRGILSSLLPKPLPNGFMVTLAQERVLDSRRISFEARGIPPSEHTELFPADDIRGRYARTISELAARPRGSRNLAADSQDVRSPTIARRSAVTGRRQKLIGR